MPLPGYGESEGESLEKSASALFTLYHALGLPADKALNRKVPKACQSVIRSTGRARDRPDPWRTH